MITDGITSILIIQIVEKLDIFLSILRMSVCSK